MKIFDEVFLEELDINATANNGNNDTHIHKGWCEMHKHPERGNCTCGAIDINADVDVDSLS